MNEEIRKIVNGYISDGDYEKALSLLTNLPLEDDADKTLLESCKYEFASSCTTTITEAVKTKDKQKAESVLASYKKIIGEDNNTTLFQTLVDGIQKESSLQQAEPSVNKPSINLAGIFKNCVPDQSFLKSKVMWAAYILLGIVAIICGCTCEPWLTLCIASVLMAVSLAILVLKSDNNQFKSIGLILLLIPIIATISLYSRGMPMAPKVAETKLSFPSIAWMTSFVFIIVYNLMISGKSWTFRVITSLLLLTILNPEWYGMIVPGGVQKFHETLYYYDFNPSSNSWIVLSLLATLGIYFFSIVGVKLSKVWQFFNKVWYFINQNKKKIGISAASIVGLFIIIIVVMNIKESYDRKIAKQQAIEQARLDSIQAAENTRIAAIERAREKARQDSIAAVRRREQARRDSIDYAEHAGFVSKYANIGLIISNIEMTRGTNSDGVATKGIKFTVFNPTHKTIKYVIVNVHAVNQFNDRVSYNERLRGMGPIASHEYGSWDFNDVFTDKNDIIDDLNVSIQVEYTNGSTKTVRLKDACVSDFKTSWFNGR